MGNMIGDPAQLASMIASSNPYDVSLSLAVTQGELYYMIRLGKLIFTSLLRYALIFFIFSTFYEFFNIFWSSGDAKCFNVNFRIVKSVKMCCIN